MSKIVTKQSLKSMIDNAENPAKVQAIVGRALFAIFEFQTNDEQRSNDTRLWNSVGFSSADAKSGSLTAKYWKKHGKLEDWMLDKWLAPDRTGYPRICKYARQLNTVAEMKRSEKQ